MLGVKDVVGYHMAAAMGEVFVVVHAQGAASIRDQGSR